MQHARAVVLVSGGASVTPFTTPDNACGSGLAAGNTATALRETLLRAGFAVFTAPVMDADTAVEAPDPASFGAFGDMPPQLPAACTVWSLGDIDDAGTALSEFALLLHAEYGVTTIDWVTHSNGGLFARAATRILAARYSPVRIGSLTTIGTPWLGGNLLRVVYGEVAESECRGDAATERILAGIRQVTATDPPLGRQNTLGYLDGPSGWNSAQAGVLAQIPLFLIAGHALQAEGGDPSFWPHDGLVSAHSALATDVPSAIVPAHRSASYPLLHSIFIADVLKRPWQAALTWNSDVLCEVRAFLTAVQRC